MTESPITISFRGATQDAPTVTLRGDGKEEIADLLEQVRDLFPTVVEVAAEYQGLGNAHTLTQPQAQPQVQQGGSPAPSAPAPQGQGAAPAPAGNVQLLKDGQNVTETDRFGNVWEYNRADAPSSPRGPMVLGTKNKRDGSGTYTKWYDPAASSAWYPRTKIPTAQQVESQWFNG